MRSMPGGTRSSILMLVLVWGTCHSRPVAARPLSISDEEAAALATIFQRRPEERKLSERERDFFSRVAQTPLADKSLIASMALAYASDAATQKILKDIAANDRSPIAQEAAKYALIVRESIGMDSDQAFEYLVKQLKEAKSPVVRVFLVNRLAVDLEKRAMPTLLDIARGEEDADIKDELLYCFNRYGDAATRQELRELHWQHRKVTCSQLDVLIFVTPGRHGQPPY